MKSWGVTPQRHTSTSGRGGEDCSATQKNLEVCNWSWMPWTTLAAKCIPIMTKARSQRITKLCYKCG